ncbi:MAG: 50S ribosome-binding GTPase [Spirochaetaceae bacterium]|nr:MAG: 50S ribosome-binding GTPase [Spirochaetaceae bacterium]
MPTNTGPEYKKAEEAFRAAKTIDEKITRLEDMMAVLPKHKGTDHLFADLKRRMSKLLKQQESSGRKSGGGPTLGFEKEGAAQVILVGPPNSGKSSILRAITNASPDIGEYPFSTHAMQPGMVQYEDIQIQLVDTPPVTAEFMPTHLLSVLRGAEAALLVADLSVDSLLDDLDAVFQAFELRHVAFVKQASGDRDRVRCRLIANKKDAPGAVARLELLREMIADRFEILPMSSNEPTTLGMLPRMLFEWLGIVRVYTKAPGKKPELEKPYTVFAGQTVGDICSLIHKDFLQNLRFARMWRGSENPLTVSKHEPVRDRDILELHI